MIKIMNKIRIILPFFVVCNLSFAILAGTAAADRLESGNYVLYDTINSGGLRMTDGDKVIRDAKGTTVGGVSSGDGIVFIPGLFGLFATGEGGYVQSTAELVDDGLIRKTNIVRKGDDLEITWDYDSGGPYAVNIYFSSGQGTEYEANVYSFTALLPVAVPSGTKKYTFSSAAYDGMNNYYRVVPNPLALGSSDLLDTKNNSITIGKVEIAVPANKFDFVALPFMEDDYLLTDVIGEQLGENGEYYFWDADTQTNPGATYSGGKWSGVAKTLTTTLRLGEGFYVRAKADKQLALVGRFGKLVAPFVRALKPKGNYNLIA
ncbi:MAG: hypothetical protein KKH83_04530, partial [Candidatus Margulisbacteria bacterium]|nr:hypothetical protein [Candidatus Margulisiibacteriota bacterium]